MNPTATPENPYAAPAAPVADATYGDELVLAERATRLGAVLLDGLMFGIAYVPLVIYLALTERGQSATLFGALFTLAILGLLAVNLVFLHRDGQTIGKKLLGIKILRSDGSRAGLARIFFMRMLPVGLLGAIPFIGLFVSLTDALLIFRDSRLCLHDQIADTIVVKA